MKVTEILADATEPLFTFELLPPLKGHTIDAINSAIDTLMPLKPAYINITNHQREVIYVDRPDGLVERRLIRKRPGTIALSAAIQYRYGIPVVPHLICGGFTKEELEDQLIELNFLGLDNVFALRGDPPRGERRFIPQKGGYEHTEGMVNQISAINKGQYIDPTLSDPVSASFCIGVAGYPEKHAEAPNLDHDIMMLKRKVDAGAHYIVTQMFFINERYFSFVERCRQAGITVPIIPGIKPISRKSDIDLLPQTFHVDLPGELVEEVSSVSSGAKVREIGMRYCIMQVRQLLDANVPGVHFYTQGNAEITANIVAKTFKR
ncbi:MAG: methylenetetrahydrofolate reductase [Sphaerochaetaceae bacterium]|jgi:methylenetetrahydrofolate reductase (NADPH)|nr:methylenetetrahydrofolate reductase [Sphaerochaetaceae bacterium]